MGRPGAVRLGGLAVAAVLGLCGGQARAAPPAEIVVDGTRVFPESLTSSRDGRVFFGSMGDGTVYRALPGAARATAWIDAKAADLKTVLGVLADDRSNTLWVCSSAMGPAAVGPTAAKAFDLASGKLKATYAFPGGTGFCNDFAIGRDRSLYVTDTSGGRVLRLRPGASALEVWSADPLLASADGVAVLDDGAVYVNTYAGGALLRIRPMPDGSAGAVERLRTTRPLVHPDGMRTARGKALLLVEGEGRLDLVTVDGLDANVAVLKEGFSAPTAVTMVGSTAYVVEPKLAYRGDPTLRDKDPGLFRALAVPEALGRH